MKSLVGSAFKIVLEASCVDGFSILAVLAQKENTLPEYQGLPFDYD